MKRTSCFAGIVAMMIGATSVYAAAVPLKKGDTAGFKVTGCTNGEYGSLQITEAVTETTIRAVCRPNLCDVSNRFFSSTYTVFRVRPQHQVLAQVEGRKALVDVIQKLKAQGQCGAMVYHPLRPIPPGF